MKTIKFSGNANDLYCVERDGQMKSIGFINLATDEENGCDLIVTLSSISLKEKDYEHKLIDELLDHNIEIIINKKD